MTPLIWTPTPPSAPGWYWYKSKSIPKRIVKVFPKYKQPDIFLVSINGRYGPVVPGGMWAGPIPEPSELNSMALVKNLGHTFKGVTNDQA